MTNDVKKTIAAKMKEYMVREKMNGRKFSSISGVSETIVSALMNDRDYVRTIVDGSEKKSEIKVRYYKLIARAIGYRLEKEYWQTYQTPQFVQIIDYLEDAKEFGYTNVLIGETGCGKSYMSDLFVKYNVQEVFKVTVGSMDTITDLLDKTCEALNIETATSKSRKIKEIISKLENMRLDGHEPMIIFDEAEYLKQATLCNMKELTDHLKGKAAIILIGTGQLERKIDALRKKDKDGIPQFYSRIKLGIRHIRAIDTSFPDFVADIQDEELAKFIQRFCTDYRQVHDLLVPVLREADRLKVNLTLELVKKYHGL